VLGVFGGCCVSEQTTISMFFYAFYNGHGKL